jgi:hypothetical protein
MTSKLKSWLPYILGLIVFSCIFFYPELQGKKLSSHDSVSLFGAVKEALIYKDKGETIKWSNRVFAGMPLYSFHGEYGNFYIKVFFKLMGTLPTQIYVLFTLIFSIFFALNLLKVDKRVSFFLALAMGTNTWIVDSLVASHSTKILALGFIGIVIAGFVNYMRSGRLIGLAAIAFSLSMAIAINHIQIVFYGAITCLLLGIFFLINAVKEKTIIVFFKKLPLLLFSVFIAVATNFCALWILEDYSKDTMRGGKSELVKVEANSTSKNGGLDINYAFSWSYTPIELFNFIVPDAMGGSSNYKVNPSKSKLAQAINREQVPMYWGDQPFTGAPNYIGAVLFFLLIFSFFYWQNNLKYFFAFLFALFGIMGLGKHFLEINEFLFNYLPLYNKFRTPTMAYSIINLGGIIMTGLSFQNFLTQENDFENKIKALKKTGYALGSILVVGFILISNAGYTSSNDIQMFQGNNELLQIAMEDRASFFKSDMFRTLFLFLLSGGLFYFNIKKSLNTNNFIWIIGILMFIDLWNVSNRFYDKDTFTKSENIEDLVPNESYNQYMIGDSSHFRMINTTTNVFNDNTDGYRYSNIGGYSPAKLYRYQDLIDVHLSKMNMPVLNMLNTKYFVVEQNGQKIVQQNPLACGNAWFVNEVKFAKNATEEMDSIGTFNPKNTAWVDIRYKSESKFDGNSDPNASITLSHYHPENMEYKSNSTSGGFVVFSEIWYRGNEDWKLYIDGNPAHLVRTNYLLRGAYIPSGSHKIEMKFKTEKLDLYTNLTFGFTILLTLFVVFAIYRTYFQKKN